MISILRARCLLLAIAFCTACGPAVQRKAQDKNIPQGSASTHANESIGWDQAVTRGVLDNGLKFFIEANSEPKGRAELRLVVLSGSTSEDDDQLGLAHVVEHMAFNGTQRFSGNQLIDTLEGFGMKFGAHLNAYTSFDETVYKLHIPTEKKLLEQAFVILREWASNISFEQSEVAKERGVVLDEWRRTRGVAGRLQDALLPYRFTHGLYARRRPIGTKTSLETFTRAQLLRFYQDWYRPENMAVVAVGDFDAATVEGLIRENFSSFRAKTSRQKRSVGAIPPYQSSQFIVVDDPELPFVSFDASTIAAAAKPTTVSGYREMMVGNIATAIINERIRELTQMAEPSFKYSALYESRLNRETVSRGLMIAPYGEKLQAALKDVLGVLLTAQKYGFSKQELERHKTRLVSFFDNALLEDKQENSADAANELVRHITTGETIPGLVQEAALVKRVLSEITRADLVEFARSFWDPSKLLVTAQFPKRAGQDVPTKDSLMTWFNDGLAQTVKALDPAAQQIGALVDDEPTPTQVTHVSRDKSLDVTEWTLGNGITVLLKPTDFEENNVRLTGWRHGGHSTADDSAYASARVASALASRSSIAGMKPTVLSKRLAGKTASASLAIGEYYVTLSGQAAPKDLETLFQLVWLRATESTIDADAFKRFKAQSAEELKNRMLNPMNTFYDRYAEILYGDHLRRRPPSFEQLESIDLNTSQTFLSKTIGDWAGTNFVIVGKFKPETIKPLVEKWLGGLPTSNAEPSFGKLDIPIFSGVHTDTVRAGIEPKSQVMIRFGGEFKSTPESRYTVRSLARVLSIRLREELRERLGGTYSASASPSVSFYPRQTYSIKVSFSCEPSRVAELKEAAYAVIEQLRAEPLAKSYTTKVAAQQLREQEVQQRDNGYWEVALRSNRDRQEAPTALALYWSLPNKLSPEFTRLAAKRYLKPGNRIELVMLPASTSEK